MEKYLKLSEVMEELERLIRTNQIEPIHVSLMNLEEIFTKMSNPLEHLVRRGVSQPMKFAEGYNIIDIGNTDDFNTPELTIVTKTEERGCACNTKLLIMTRNVWEDKNKRDALIMMAKANGKIVVVDSKFSA